MWKIHTLQLMAERCEEDSLVVTWLPDGILFEMAKHKVSAHGNLALQMKSWEWKCALSHSSGTGTK